MRAGRNTHTLSRLGRWVATALALCLTAPVSLAQGQFVPVVTVNDQAITGFELEQRIRMLDLFRTPGNLPEIAREQLIEDRLKNQLLRDAGLEISEAALRTELEAFAGRANLDYDQFVTLLGQNGVAEETLRDFVEIGVSWRDYVRLRFGDQVNITAADIDRALGEAGQETSGIEILLSEIIIPAPPPELERARSVARQIAGMTSTGAFEAAAREYSALPSRENGGRLGWLPLSNYPAGLHALLLGLAPGEVTAPIEIENGIALFQLRDIRETAASTPAPARIDYAIFTLPGGLSESGRAEAARVARQVDVCDDLYGVAQGLPPERLARIDQTPAEIPQDIAIELARLDPGEFSASLTRDGGQTLLFIMLCSRTAGGAEGADRAEVEAQLRGRRLADYAAALLAETRAAAVIVGE